MKIALISDTHCHEPALPKDVDMVIHAGDFSYKGRLGETVFFLEWFESLPIKHRVFISGNHDFMQENDPKLFDELLQKHAPTVTCLNDTSIVIDGLKIHGSPVQPEFYSWAFNRRRGDEIMEHWALIPDDTDILVTHGPPYKILDFVERDESHVGCEDLLKVIKKIKPKVHLFGHIHQGFGTKRVGKTLFVNASIMDEGYKPTNHPIIVDVTKKTAKLLTK